LGHLFTVTTYKFEITTTVLITNILLNPNMKGTVYGNRLPRGMQVKRGWEPLMYSVKRECMDFLTPASDIQCHLNSFCPIVLTHGAQCDLN
jgi:hypothetical protein